MQMTLFGERATSPVFEIRNDHRLSQKDFAEALGQHIQNIKRYELGTANGMTEGFARRLAEYVGHPDSWPELIYKYALYRRYLLKKAIAV